MSNEPTQLGRRAFLKSGALILTATSHIRFVDAAQESDLRIGMVTDLHFADKPSAGSRHYRETLGKLAEASKEFDKQKVDFTIEMGDFIDAANTVKEELGYLQRVNREFSAISEKRHYVLGNHCVYTLTKREFLDTVGQQKSYYSFDSGNYHFVVLDSCFRSDGQPYERKNFNWTDPNIPDSELEWLKGDLRGTTKKTIVFAHQRLDVTNSYGVKNAAAVRKLMEDAGNVLAVFQGHSHKNAYTSIEGIHYCTLVAMVEGTGDENNGYSVLTVSKDGTMRLDGFRQQDDYTWS